MCIDGSDIRLLALAAFARSADGAWQETAREEMAVGPESFLAAITRFVPIEEVEGIIIVQGPGSATALRASLAIANTLAMAKGIPLCGVEKGAAWESVLVQNGLQTPVDHLEPVYGAAARITQSTKDHLRRSI
ncbi:MAG: hypothetical protein Q7R47_02120 [Candidatus Diapherotrites archaeon]|nr:hypothetical protein [Candidatus Diapherotrites archaeon]